MLHQHGKKIKVVVGKDGFDFECKLNSVLDSFNREGISYELSYDIAKGFISYIVYEENILIPENAADEYELLGEQHNCIECPLFVRPTDGRQKYTECPHNHSFASKDRPCCDDFYEWLKKGEIKLVEVMK